ncbi:hypothetical protein AX15_007758 [Amanita polypyramis BW_CC]|nr:hypothetical protein AX15_007758 [Amanita polypyramis BW_CC]
MDNCTHKLLETAALRTLHAHAFSRSSSLALHVLTDLLSRYFALLASTCAKYAHHAGRRSFTLYDALGALDELGISMDELSDFAAIEAKELSRYAVYSTRRIEDLNELRAQLAEGLRQDRDDRLHLTYAPYEPLEESDEESVAEADQMEVDEEAPLPIAPPKWLSPRPPSLLPLPLSPVSNPTSSPSRKRPRTAGWQPPEHVPNFLPPFPTATPPSPVSPPPPEAEEHQMPPPMMPPLPPPLNIKLERPQIPLPQSLQTTQQLQQQTMTSSAASDYLVQVPYSQSSLSSIPEWHLPSSVPPASRHASSRNPPQPTPQTEHSLLAAYHYILTHPPPLHPLFPGRTTIPASTATVPIGPNTLHPSRHKVAMTLLYQTQTLPRWEPADSAFATVGPCPPRVAAIGPTYPIPIPSSDDKDKNSANKDFKFPPMLARPVGAPERIAPLVSQQGSRIPDLARHVLPPMIFSRTSRLSHPPILYRGQKPLTYGQGVPAPWNSNPSPSEAATQPPTPATAKPGAKDALTNGKEKNKDANSQAKSVVLPDAKLYATWDYEPKDYRAPLIVPSRSRARIAGATSSTHLPTASPSVSSPLVTTTGGLAGTGATTGSVSGLRSRSSSRLVS